MVRVICAGHVNWDVTLAVDALPDPDGEAEITEQHQSGGGSASNTAVVLAGLDVEPHLFGSVGTDENGWLVRRELADLGVETTLVDATGLQTAVKYLVVAPDGEVMVLGNDGANEAYAASDLPEDALAAADHLHLTSQSPDTAVELAERAVAADVPVSYDPGRRVAERPVGDVLAHVDLLFCNEHEAAAIDGADDVATVVTKHGAEGASARTPDERVEHPGFAVDPVDTAGAGDAFAAGYLAARFDGGDPAYALAVANACGALAARSRGARLRIGWRDVEALLDVGPAE